MTNREEVYKEVFLVGVILFLSWLQLQLSCICYTFVELSKIDCRFILLNIATVSVLLSFLFIVCNSLWRSCALFSGISMLLSVVNRYTIQWHDAPLTIATMRNWKAAFNVLSNYHLSLTGIIDLVTIFVAMCFSTYKLRQLTKSSKMIYKKRAVSLAFWGLATFSIFFFGYFSPWPIMPQSNGLSWISDYQKYGYVNCMIRAARQEYNAKNMWNTWTKSGQYDTFDIGSLQIEEDAPSTHTHETPDVILILNETFYDLSLLVDINTDVSYLENIKSLENSIQGYAVNPAGGTNPSEYELLTSNSMKPMHGLYPFITLDMDNANSVVSHLKALGYCTTGAHCAQAENYNRGKVYPGIGFDSVHFENDFVGQEYYGSRMFATDACVYKNLLTWYQDSSKATPQFLYLLTIQNHGGWQMNDRELDIVHAQENFGEYDEDVDEYLSCISLSDQAFKDLTDQLKSIDRKVIVCMVGDHGPTFTGKIIEDPESQHALRLRTSVPFIIWANYPLDDTLNLNGTVISMNYLIPSLLKTANISLSPYYQQMLILMEKVPILTAYSGYYDKYDILHDYNASVEYKEMVDLYFYLECNSLQMARNQRLFKPYHCISTK